MKVGVYASSEVINDCPVPLLRLLFMLPLLIVLVVLPSARCNIDDDDAVDAFTDDTVRDGDGDAASDSNNAITDELVNGTRR
jgi:hypothetical protein